MDPPLLKLIMLQGPREGETLAYKPGTMVRIGRVVRGNNLPLKDSGISSKHLQISCESGKWILRDLGSSNGTFLNSNMLPPDAPFDLRHGDTIKLGEYTSILVNFLEGLQQPPKPRRNPRRQARESDAVDLVTENQRQTGRVLTESKESEIVKRLPTRGRALKSQTVEELKNEMGNLEEKVEKRVNSRVTRSRKVEVAENSGLDCGEPDIVAKKTRRAGRRRKDLKEEPPECAQIHAVADEGRNLGAEAGINIAAVEHNVEDLRLGGGQCEEAAKQSGDKFEKRSDSEVKESSHKVEDEGDCEVTNSCDAGDKRSGFGVRDGGESEVDLEKMTLGEWFDYMEVHLPKQIIEETEEMIEAMRKKAERVHEYMTEKKKQKGKVPVG